MSEKESFFGTQEKPGNSFEQFENDFCNGLARDIRNQYSALLSQDAEGAIDVPIASLPKLETYQKYFARYGEAVQGYVMENSNARQIEKFDQLVETYNGFLVAVQSEENTMNKKRANEVARAFYRQLEELFVDAKETDHEERWSGI